MEHNHTHTTPHHTHTHTPRKVAALVYICISYKCPESIKNILMWTNLHSVSVRGIGDARGEINIAPMQNKNTFKHLINWWTLQILHRSNMRCNLITIIDLHLLLFIDFLWPTSLWLLRQRNNEEKYELDASRNKRIVIYSVAGQWCASKPSELCFFHSFVAFYDIWIHLDHPIGTSG